jgi:hypothetical protein
MDLIGLRVPDQFYWVRSVPPLLAGMSLPPRDTPWAALHQMGFRHVVCLCSDRPLYDPVPLQWLVTVELCDLDERSLPEDPEEEERAIRIISRAVVGCLEKDEGVIVHCAGGRGRTGTVLGCVLREMGHQTSEIVTFLDAVHKQRGKSGWPESEWQTDVVKRGSESP